MEFQVPCADPIVFEDEDLYNVSRQFQLVMCIQGKPGYPHYAKQLRSSNKKAETRRKLKQYTHWQGAFTILYVMIFCPNGPELGMNNRHEVAKEQVSQNPEFPEHKVPSSIRSRQDSGDRRERLGECLFWEATIREDGGPDVDILSRKSVFQSGVPAEAIEEWADDSEYLSRVGETARAINQRFSSDQG